MPLLNAAKAEFLETLNSGMGLVYYPGPLVARCIPQSREDELKPSSYSAEQIRGLTNTDVKTVLDTAQDILSKICIRMVLQESLPSFQL